MPPVKCATLMTEYIFAFYLYGHLDNLTNLIHKRNKYRKGIFHNIQCLYLLCIVLFNNFSITGLQAGV